MRKMLSIENQNWVKPRQKLNVPYGCIDCRYTESASLIQDLRKLRRKYKVENVLCWLDYASSIELASQLNEVRALLPSLAANDILKVTLAANPSVLGTKTGANDPELFQRRLEELRQRLLGTQFLADGITTDQMTEGRYPEVLTGAFQRVVAEAMKESPELVFQPLGSYVYKDTSQMVTLTGIVLSADQVDAFRAATALGTFDLAGLSWELLRIDVPHLSLREKLLLDQFLFNKTAHEIESKIHIQLAPDREDSLRMVENYVKYYRYYPNYQRVVL
jgi:hypothetical protein